MLFSGIPFLYYFLPIVLILYYISPKVLRNSVLLLASLVFYAWGEPVYVFLMLGTILCGYVLGIAIEKTRGRALSRVFLALSVILDLGALAYFKYTDFFIANFNAATGLSIPLLSIALPVGISFYTFQILSYTIDVFRGDVKAQKNPIDLAAYITMFPQLIAGPIVRYSDVEKQLHVREISFDKAALGVRRFVLGIGKKVLIANQLGELCDMLNASAPNVSAYWVSAVAFALQIYFDFSGYSDMAIGLGHLLGFDFLENFNYPFISRSITEFWRRWHISLGTWFRDYVYIPLGGNRVKPMRWFFNIFVVWMLTGFWHGAAWNFVLWGLFFAVFLLLEKLVLAKLLNGRRIISHIYVLLITLISFVIFNSESLGDIAGSLCAMSGLSSIPLITGDTAYYLGSYAVILILAILGATPLPKRLMSETAPGKALGILEPLFLAAVLVLVTAYLVDGSFNPFLYFRF